MFLTNSELKQQINCFVTKKGAVLHLKHPCAFQICGDLQVSVLNGAINVFGYDLNSDSRMRSIKLNSSIKFESFVIETKEDTSDEGYPDLFHLWSYLEENDRVSILRNKNPNDAVILIEPREMHFKNALPYMSEDMVPVNEDSFTIFPDVLKKFKITIEEIDATTGERFLNNRAWQMVRLGKVNMIQSCGGLGKTRYAKYLTNRLLIDHESVIFLDIDVGQNEFVPPGCIALVLIEKPILGQNYSHQVQILQMINVGYMNATLVVKQYKSAVSKLINYASQNDYMKYPWIVNTIGLFKGLGIGLAQQVIRIIKPTNVITIKDHSNNLIEELRPDKLNMDYAFLTVDNGTQEENPFLRSKDKIWRRSIMTISYFSSVLKNPGDTFKSIDPYREQEARVTLLNEYLHKISPTTYCTLCGDTTQYTYLIASNAQPGMPMVHSKRVWALLTTWVGPWRELPNHVGEEWVKNHNRVKLRNVAVGVPQGDLNASALSYYKKSLISLSERHPYGYCQVVDGFKFFVNPMVMPCMGLGLVVDIDLERKEFVIISPLSEADILKTKFINISVVPVPQQFFCESIYSGDGHRGLEFRSINAEHNKVLKWTRENLLKKLKPLPLNKEENKQSRGYQRSHYYNNRQRGNYANDSQRQGRPNENVELDKNDKDGSQTTKAEHAEGISGGNENGRSAQSQKESGKYGSQAMKTEPAKRSSRGNENGRGRGKQNYSKQNPKSKEDKNKSGESSKSAEKKIYDVVKTNQPEPSTSSTQSQEESPVTILPLSYIEQQQQQSASEMQQILVALYLLQQQQNSASQMQQQQPYSALQILQSALNMQQQQNAALQMQQQPQGSEAQMLQQPGSDLQQQQNAAFQLQQLLSAAADMQQRPQGSEAQMLQQLGSKQQLLSGLKINEREPVVERNLFDNAFNVVCVVIIVSLISFILNSR